MTFVLITILVNLNLLVATVRLVIVMEILIFQDLEIVKRKLVTAFNAYIIQKEILVKFVKKDSLEMHWNSLVQVSLE